MPAALDRAVQPPPRLAGVTNIEGIADLLKQTADTIINPRFRQLAAGEVEEKTPGDFVTVADKESEAHLTKLLHERYPDAAIVGEEAVFTDPGLLDLLGDAEHAFVIDPIDGTRNFVEGRDEHGVILAELQRGETVRGWIWQPQTERLFTVERGSGQVLLNGEPFHGRQRHDRPQGATSQRRKIGFDAGGVLEPLAVSTGAACFDYPSVLSGETDFMCFSSTNPWDHLAGALMLTETGGVARLFTGEDYTPSTHGSWLLVARTEEIWQLVADNWRD